MSGRTLTGAIDTELGQSTTAPRWLAKLEFDSGDVRIWNGLGDLNAFSVPFLDFNGTTSDYVISSGVSGFPTTALTVELWIKTSDSGERGLFSYAIGATPDDNEILLHNPNSLKFYINNGSRDSGISVADGEWHHVAFTWQSSNGAVILYVDGVNVYSTSGLKTAYSVVDGGTVVFGQDQDSLGGGFVNSQAFLGKMNDVRIWNDVRTPAEISAKFDVRLTGAEDGLVSYWRLDEGSGPTALDIVGSNDGTIVGASWDTTGAGPFSEVFTGAGRLVSIEPIQETQETVASGVRMSLSIQPTSDQPDAVDAILNIALGEEYQGRPVTIWQAQIDHTDGSLIGDPFIRFKGKMDVMEDSELPGSATITITAENRLIDLERSRRRTYTPEDHKASHSGDTFFDEVSALQNREIRLE